MTFDEYQREASRTMGRADGEGISAELHLAVMALGCAGEAGEVADLVKKTLGHGHPLDRERLKKELGCGMESSGRKAAQAAQARNAFADTWS